MPARHKEEYLEFQTRQEYLVRLRNEGGWGKEGTEEKREGIKKQRRKEGRREGERNKRREREALQRGKPLYVLISGQ